MMGAKGNRSETPVSSGSHVTSAETTSEDPGQAGGQKMSVDSRSTHWDAILNEVGTPVDSEYLLMQPSLEP